MSYHEGLFDSAILGSSHSRPPPSSLLNNVLMLPQIQITSETVKGFSTSDNVLSILKLDQKKTRTVYISFCSKSIPSGREQTPRERDSPEYRGLPIGLVYPFEFQICFFFLAEYPFEYYVCKRPRPAKKNRKKEKRKAIREPKKQVFFDNGLDLVDQILAFPLPRITD